MNVFTRLAARTLHANCARTVVSLCGIILSSLLLTAIFTSVSTLSNLLVTSTIAASGSWQVAYSALTKDDVADVLADSRVTALAEIERYGFARADSGEEGDDYFTYFSLSSLPNKGADKGVVPAISLVEGRLPRNSSEVVIPESIRGYNFDGGFDSDGFQQSNSFMVGTTLGLSLGTRQGSADGAAFILDENNSVHMDERGRVQEELVDVAPMREFTIVGLYSMDGVQNEFWDTPSGYSLITFDDGGIDPIYSSAYVCAGNLDSYKDMESLARRFDEKGRPIGATLHNDLLSYQGLTEHTAESGAFWTIGCLLSVIVLAASVTLVYNSFAISVAERIRQFGLLSSLGASNRQLRVAIYTEAIALALIGIPTGILLGIASTHAAFAVSQDGLIALLYGNGAIQSSETSIRVVVSAPVIVGIAAIEAATLLVSTAVPAMRASRVSAVDALRQPQELGKAQAKPLRTPGRADKRRRPAFLTSRIDRAYLACGGVPHLLARRNLNRPSSKGRIAVASLAISVALLVLSGTLVNYLEQLVDLTGVEGVDVTVNLDRDIQQGESVADLLRDARAVGDQLDQVEGSSLIGYSSLIASYGTLPRGVYNTHALDSIRQESEISEQEEPTVVDGSYYGSIHVAFVDDVSWRAYIDELGLDAKDFCDLAHPCAVALNGQVNQWGTERYTIDSFSGTGTATLYTCIQALSDTTPNRLAKDHDGRVVVEYYSYDEDASVVRLPLAQAVQGTYDVPIGAIASSAPTCIVDLPVFSSPVLILPISALETISSAALPAVEQARAQELAAGISPQSRWHENNPFTFYPSNGSDNVYKPPLTSTYAFSSPNPQQATENLARELNGMLNNRAMYPFGYANDATEATRTQRAIILAIEIFTWCFAGITTLIAIANVFNTISTSILLRRREFAVLQSIGMDNKMFRRMIVRECASYAARGLVLGLSLALAAILLLFSLGGAMTADVSFSLPVGWIALSALVVLLVLTVSTVYALRKIDAGTMMESLREDLS